MPRFFFDLVDSKAILPDPNGIDLPDAQACRSEAAERAREIVAEGVRNGEDRTGWEFRISDETHKPVLRVPFTHTVP